MKTISARIISSSPFNTTLPSSPRSVGLAVALVQRLYASRPCLRSPPDEQPTIKIVCISDSHNTTPHIPDGDILLHAGDLTNKGSFAELQAQLTLLNSLPHAYKIVVAGNHDLLLDADFCDQFPHRVASSVASDGLDWESLVYLKDRCTTLTIYGREITIYGSPWMPYCGSWAFQHPPIWDVWKADQRSSSRSESTKEATKSMKHVLSRVRDPYLGHAESARDMRKFNYISDWYKGVPLHWAQNLVESDGSISSCLGLR